MNTVSKSLFEKISRQKADISFVDFLYEADDIFYFGINNHVYGYSPDIEKPVFESYVRSIKDPVILLGFLVENAVLVDFERSDFDPLMESLYIGKKTSLRESEDEEGQPGDPEDEESEASEDETDAEDEDFFSDEEEESEYSRAYGAAYTEGFEDAVSGKENRYEAEAEDSESSDSESDDSENEESEEEAEEMEESFTGSDQSAGGLGYGGLGEEQYPGEDLAVEPVYKESEESDEDAEDTDPDFTDETPDDETPDDEEPYPEDENMSETEMGERDGYEDGYADGLIFSQEMSDEGEEDEETEEIDAEDEGEITEGLTIPDPSAPQKLLLRTLLKAMDQEPRDHARLTPMIGSNVPSGYPRVSNAMWQSLSRSQLAKKDQGGWYLTQRGADTLTDEKEVTESKKRTSKNTNLHESSEKSVPWRKLRVYNAGDSENKSDSLKDFLDAADDAKHLPVVAADGSISEWDQFFVAAKGEDPDWDTPKGPVDWTGFADAVQKAEKRIKKGVKEAFEDDEFEEEDDADDEAILGMLSEQEAIEVFCDFLECDQYEIEASWEDERGEWHFVIDNQEYLVNQDREVLPQNGV